MLVKTFTFKFLSLITCWRYRRTHQHEHPLFREKFAYVQSGGATLNTGATLNKFDFFDFRKNTHLTTASGNMVLSGIISQEAQLSNVVVTNTLRLHGIVRGLTKKVFKVWTKTTLKKFGGPAILEINQKYFGTMVLKNDGYHAALPRDFLNMLHLPRQCPMFNVAPGNF